MDVLDHRELPRFNGELAPVVFGEGGIDLLDQTLLPRRRTVLHITSYRDLADAIRTMRVRGAPAIGIAAAYGVVLGMMNASPKIDLEEHFAVLVNVLLSTRPTAVNLSWALDRMRGAFRDVLGEPREQMNSRLLEEAWLIHSDDIAANRRMGRLGATLLADGSRVLTHCNTGALATGGYGTALGVIRAAWESGKLKRVYVDETRPVLQGARLTAWELSEEGIAYDLIADGAAASLMALGLVNAVLVGADRIAANGDVANKVGTYGLAVLARYHGLPFYVVAPTSSFDLSIKAGAEIPIEQRNPHEVAEIKGVPIAPASASVLNPAFDVTPNDLVTAIVTEKLVLKPPFEERIGNVL